MKPTFNDSIWKFFEVCFEFVFNDNKYLSWVHHALIFPYEQAIACQTKYKNNVNLKYVVWYFTNIYLDHFIEKQSINAEI